MIDKQCVVCAGHLHEGCTDWHFLCHSCGYELGELQPAINTPEAHQEINECARETGLRALRQSNFEKLVTIIRQHWPATEGRLLDVGAAHGWFLDAAAKYFRVLGIEPDNQVFSAAQKQGKPIRQGYFPEALHEGELFDIIVFNDVIEHIPDIPRILLACHARLSPGGLLMLNLPSSKGIFYRGAKLLHGLGIYAPFERLWQKGLPSPHVHYFHAQNLANLLGSHGFNEQACGRLPALQLRGLFTRISYTGEYSLLTRCILYALVASSLPLLKIMPADIIYSVFKRQ